jgi:hypothetical protein
MAIPVVLGGVAGAIASVVGGVSAIAGTISRQPLLAYFMLLGVLMLDGGLSFYTNTKGVFGELITFVFFQLGVPIPVYSWHVLMLVAITPIVIYAFHTSGNN